MVTSERIQPANSGLARIASSDEGDGNGLAGIERGLDPRKPRLFGAGDRLLQRISGREAAGQIRHDDAVGSFSVLGSIAIG